MKVDVVVPTKGEATLKHCIAHVRQYIPVNNLILVAPTSIANIVAPFADIVVSFDEANTGKARKKGLELVQTDVYASIDSDVLINPDWFNWCFNTIQNPSVGACQGYAKPIAKIYGRSHERWIRTGPVCDGVPLPCDLGNALLKTEIVHRIGMPSLRAKEDLELYRRMRQIGYKWITNVNLVSVHLKTDLDLLKHTIRWKRRGGANLKDYVKKIPYRATQLTRTEHVSGQANFLDMAILFLHDFLFLVISELLG